MFLNPVGLEKNELLEKLVTQSPPIREKARTFNKTEIPLNVLIGPSQLLGFQKLYKSGPRPIQEIDILCNSLSTAKTIKLKHILEHKMLKSIINWLSAYASFAGLYFAVKPEQSLTKWQLFFLAILTVVFIRASLVDLWNEKKSLPKKYQSKTEIINYMYNMLKKCGVCEICSRDASWITDSKIYNLLIEKSKKKELKLYVHTKTKNVNDLEKNGAEVIDYGKFGFDPLTRFTIVNSGNHACSYVAIGKQKPNEPHIIEELDSSHPTYSMAKDLIQSINVAAKNHNG